MQPGQVLIVTITDLARAGSGVARDQEGFVIFVPLTLPGDVVRVEVVECDKHYAKGKILEILQSSEDRIPAPCPAFSQCGGCEWQHVPYEKQWQVKVQGLRLALDRVKVKYTEPFTLFPAQGIWNYRNKVQLRGFKSELGFYARGSNTIVPIDSCMIARPEINEAIAHVKQQGQHFDRPYKVEIFLDEENRIQVIWNSRHSAAGFRQIHDDQNEKLRKWVESEIPSDTFVLDLFGGKGNLSRNLCARVKEVHCVDLGAWRERPANYPENFYTYKSDVTQWLCESSAPGDERVIAILDPPREGLSSNGNKILRELARLGVKKILAIGCDTNAWAADLCRMQKHNWEVRKIAALDLFPQTHHVEALAVLESGIEWPGCASPPG